MKVDESGLQRLLQAPERYRVILVHGDDPSLVAERVHQIVAALARQGHDMFGPAEFEGAEHGRAVQALMMPRLGGAGVVRLRDATDAAVASMEAALRGAAGGCLVAEAGTLLARSKLRALAEGHRDAASVWCRGGLPRQIAAGVDAVLRTDSVSILPEARTALLDGAMGYGEAAASAALLVLLVGPGGLVSVADVLAVTSGIADARLDELADSVALGQRREADGLLEACYLDGLAPVAVIRGLLLQFARLRTARLEVDAGRSVPDAMGSLRPPVFQARAHSVQAALERWSAAALDGACAALWRSDHACRRTGSPAISVCRDVVQTLLAGPRPVTAR